MTVGEKIRKYRLLCGKTQKELGLDLGFTARTADVRVNQYEKDKMAPKAEIRNRIAEVLGVHPSALSDVDIQSEIDVLRGGPSWSGWCIRGTVGEGRRDGCAAARRRRKPSAARHNSRSGYPAPL